MSRLSFTGLLALGADLSDVERDVVKTVARFRLMSQAQLAVILGRAAHEATTASTARSVRRILQRLTDRGVLARLDRRVGGLRAGSEGFVYFLGSAGQRLVACWDGQGLTRGRFRPEPGGRYVQHRLAVSGLYADVLAASHRGDLDLLAFDVEPDCWRNSLDGFGGQTILKPDAFVRVGVGAYEDRFFVEVDLASESRSVIARKARAYVDYFHSGQEQAEHDVFPRVLILTTTDRRREILADVCSRLPAETWQLFTVGLLRHGVDLIAGHIEDDAHGDTADGDLV